MAALVANDLRAGGDLAVPGDRGVTLEAVRGAGALAAAVSGTGPTVFGIFPDAAAAEAAAARRAGLDRDRPV